MNSTTKTFLCISLAAIAVYRPVFAQQAPSALSAQQQTITIYCSPLTTKQERADLLTAAQDVLSKNGPSLSYVLKADAAGTPELVSSQTNGDAGGLGVTASGNSSGNGSGGGFTYAHTFERPNDFIIRLGVNATAQQTVSNQNSGTGSGATTSAPKVDNGAALLSPGSQTQSFNVQFAKRIPRLSHTFKQPSTTEAATSLKEKYNTVFAKFNLLHALNLDNTTATPSSQDVNELALTAIITEYNKLQAEHGTATDSSESLSDVKASFGKWLSSSSDNAISTTGTGTNGSGAESDTSTVGSTDTAYYVRLSAGMVTFSGKDTSPGAVATATTTESGGVIAPSAGLQFTVNGTDKNVFGIEAGWTHRSLTGTIAQDAAFRSANLGTSSKEFDGWEGTLFAKLGTVTPYIRWTRINGDTIHNFTRSQITIGADVFTTTF